MAQTARKKPPEHYLRWSRFYAYRTMAVQLLIVAAFAGVVWWLTGRSAALVVAGSFALHELAHYWAFMKRGMSRRRLDEAAVALFAPIANGAAASLGLLLAAAWSIRIGLAIAIVNAALAMLALAPFRGFDGEVMLRTVRTALDWRNHAFYVVGIVGVWVAGIAILAIAGLYLLPLLLLLIWVLHRVWYRLSGRRPNAARMEPVEARFLTALYVCVVVAMTCIVIVLRVRYGHG